jgi:hypothetical protein
LGVCAGYQIVAVLPLHVGDRVHRLERRVRDVRELERGVERRQQRQHGRERQVDRLQRGADVGVGGGGERTRLPR